MRHFAALAVLCLCALARAAVALPAAAQTTTTIAFRPPLVPRFGDTTLTNPPHRSSSATSAICPAYTNPPVVTAADIDLIAAHWSQTLTSVGWDARYDLDQDGMITVNDVLLASAQLGQTCLSAAY